ncbi:MAG: alpha/beta hydrolase [Bacteroidetes bacterium]|jgi:acetyl esterase/lipase|nr:alpha/beta hydrolase [Bacteroidota bacterium]MDF1863960.1 alpha/beta hydrolase [Saprospiraceae bacterium]
MTNQYPAIFSLLLLSFLTTLSFGQNRKNVVKIEPEIITYKTIDTISLELEIYRPLDFDKSKTYKAVVFYHGGGWNGGKPKLFRRQAMYFASRGMITICPEYRLKNIHGTTPFECVKDAKSAFRYIRKNAKDLNIDPDWIAAGGGSAGGHLAAVLGNIEGLDERDEDHLISIIPEALLLFNPVFDNGPNGYGYRRVKDRHLEISPIHNISKGAPPTIVFLGTEDKLIPVSTAEDYKLKMEGVGSRCDLHLYEGVGHAFFAKPPVKYFVETTYQSDLFLISLGFLDNKPTIYEQYGQLKE